jgi:hypothetical protein
MVEQDDAHFLPNSDACTEIISDGLYDPTIHHEDVDGPYCELSSGGIIIRNSIQ